MSTSSSAPEGEEVGMYLVDTATNSEGEKLCLVACPACHRRFFDGHRPLFGDTRDLSHDQMAVLIAHHVATHDPEDFGLSEEGYRFTPMADILIKLHGLDGEAVEQ